MCNKEVAQVIGDYIQELFTVVLIALPFYLLLRMPWMTWSKREASLAVFVLFMVGLLMLTVGIPDRRPDVMLREAAVRIRNGYAINLVPFRSIVSYFRHYGTSLFLINFVGNIVMFMPWGFGLVLLWKRKQRISSVILHALALTLFIETAQLFVGRSVDVDDVILNFIGSCLGAAAYFLLRKLFPEIGKLAL